jgi:hypothetical protein
MMPTEYVPCEVRTERLCITQSDLILLNHAVAHISCKPVTAEPWVLSLATLCETCRGRSGLMGRFSAHTSVFPSVLFHTP